MSEHAGPETTELTVSFTRRQYDRIRAASERDGIAPGGFVHLVVLDTLSKRSNELSRPPDPTLPLFVYGNLLPGELGHDLVSGQVLRSERASAVGSLREIDGMPILDIDRPQWSVDGALLWFGSETAYDDLASFEPASHYKWSTTTVTGESGDILANVLTPVDNLPPEPSDGSKHVFRWSTTSDPLFRHGLPAVAETLRRDGLQRFPRGLGDDDWQRFYRLQAAYMLGSSVLERVTLRTIPGKLTNPTATITKLGKTEPFITAVKEAGFIPGRAVYRADRPTTPVQLDGPEDFAEWAYQIRSNLVHQGKSASQEAELVRVALLQLHDTLRVYLLARMPNFADVWTQTDPQGIETNWRIKPLLEPELAGAGTPPARNRH